MTFSKAFSSLAVAAIFTISAAAVQAAPAQLVTNNPQASPGDTAGWSARQNRIESHQYDHLLETNPGFRSNRIRKECGPVTDPQLHQQCVESVSTAEPASTPGRHR